MAKGKNITTPAEVAEDTMGLTTIANGYILPIGNDFAEAMADEMNGLSITFGRIKIPSGGGLAFEIPGDDPENPDVVKEIVGIIVDHHPVNTYYANPYTGGNEPPDCSSLDGIAGKGNPGGNCALCPFNQFGSGRDGKGKACSNRHRLYILTKDNMFPLLLTIPATSLRELSNYICRSLLAKGRRSNGVETRITLKKDKNAGGIEYSKAVFSLARVLSPQEAAVMKEYSAKLKMQTRRVAAEFDASDSPDNCTSQNSPPNNEDIPF